MEYNSQLPNAIPSHDHVLLGLWSWPFSLSANEPAGEDHRDIYSPAASISSSQPSCNF